MTRSALCGALEISLAPRVPAQSMSAPGDLEMQHAASLALLPNVASVRVFFELSRDMEQVRILSVISSHAVLPQRLRCISPLSARSWMNRDTQEYLG